MTLSYNCVIQNFTVGDLAVGDTEVVVETAYGRKRVFEICRMTDEYCSVKEVK